jgi:hypothetical protein
MKCEICQSETTKIFNATVLGKYDVSYYQCATCYFVQTDEPFWLDEAYNNALNIEDTGTLVRNQKFARLLTLYLILYHGKNAKFVDWGGGFGIFTRQMRDIGFDFYWSDKYAANLVARGLEYNVGMGRVSAITAFEVFEHLTHPMAEIKAMLEVSDTIIFSTEPISYPAPEKNNWWYYAFEHGQHISFYNHFTLKKVADLLGLNYYNNGFNLHILTKAKHNALMVKLVLRLAKYTFWFAKLFLQSKTNSDSRMLNRQNTF